MENKQSCAAMPFEKRPAAPGSATFGYCRISTDRQNEARQLLALTREGVEKKNIFVDKASGKDFLRPEYNRLLDVMKEGDLLIIQSVDRLGRNYDEMIIQWNHIVKERKIDIAVLDIPILDTRYESSLTGHFVTDLVLQTLSYFAEMERRFNIERTKQGIAAAKERGVKFGPPAKKIPKEFGEVCRLYKEEKISRREASRRLGVAPQTFKRWCGEG